MARIVIATVGTLGDLFPFLALGAQLHRRGHRITIAVHGKYRRAVEAAGLVFADASGLPEPADPEAFYANVFHPWRGPPFVVQHVAAVDARDSYMKLRPLCAEADLLVTSPLAFGAQIVGETIARRWASAVLAPGALVSTVDERISHSWTAPVRAFRTEIGLPAVSPLGDPLHRGQHAPACVLAMFSPLLGKAAIGWPAQTWLTGFAFHTEAASIDPALAAFMKDGEAPLVFTLGSSAAHAGERFLHTSLETALALGRRAVLFTGSAAMRARLPSVPATVHCVDYASHAEVFPRAAAIVHHGGVGTSAQALRAGRPALVVPHGFDQPDNAKRLRRLGCAEVLPAARYDVARATSVLGQLLCEPRYNDAARDCAQLVQREDGASTAADVIEALLA